MMWVNGVAEDEDEGDFVTLKFQGSDAKHAQLIDVLNGFEQELIVENVNGDLFIRDILIKDYPLIIRLGEISS
jgi:hypothetical protein